MPFTLKYIALRVSDLRAAEDYYAKVFAMTLLFRESEQDAETWRTLRPEVDWDGAESAGITIDMVSLRRDAFVLALFRGTPAPDAVFEFCVGIELDEIGAVRSRLPNPTNVIESRPDNLRFEDPFGFRWAVQRTDARVQEQRRDRGALARPTRLAAELGRDTDVDLDTPLERGDVDPLDLRVRTFAERAEEDGRDARGGKERRVGPERHAGDLRLRP